LADILILIVYRRDSAGQAGGRKTLPLDVDDGGGGGGGGGDVYDYDYECSSSAIRNLNELLNLV
jgi:hypothetical protein